MRDVVDIVKEKLLRKGGGNQMPCVFSTVALLYWRVVHFRKKIDRMNKMNRIRKLAKGFIL